MLCENLGVDKELPNSRPRLITWLSINLAITYRQNLTQVMLITLYCWQLMQLQLQSQHLEHPKGGWWLWLELLLMCSLKTTSPLFSMPWRSRAGHPGWSLKWLSIWVSYFFLLHMLITHKSTGPPWGRGDCPGHRGQGGAPWKGNIKVRLQHCDKGARILYSK